MDICCELQLSGLGRAAWDLSHAQAMALFAKLREMRDRADLQRFHAHFSANPQSKEAGELAQQWIDSKL